MAKKDKSKKTDKTKKVSKSRIERLLQRKTNPHLKELIIKFKKKPEPWPYVAYLLARPERKIKAVNLEKINKLSKENDTILVPGKVLGQGTMNHKITLAAFSFSEQAKEKLKNCNIETIEKLAEKNPKFKIII